ncbi:hypothetical protein Gotur_029685, partial [Gossypium turneri]
MHGHLRLLFFQVEFLWEMIHLTRDLMIQMNIVMRMKVFLLMRYHQTLLMKILIEESKHLGLCESMASPRKSVNEIIFPHSQYTISNAIDTLCALGDEIPKKKDELYYFSIKMFQISMKREVFLNLDPNVRVWWLRHKYAEQNPHFSSL